VTETLAILLDASAAIRTTIPTKGHAVDAGVEDIAITIVALITRIGAFGRNRRCATYNFRAIYIRMPHTGCLKLLTVDLQRYAAAVEGFVDVTRPNGRAIAESKFVFVRVFSP